MILLADGKSIRTSLLFHAQLSMVFFRESADIHVARNEVKKSTSTQKPL